MKIQKIDIKLWKNRHPRASKVMPDMYVDFNPEGSKKDSSYSYTGSRNIVVERDGYHCRACQSDDGEYEVQHIIPKKDGGTNHPANLITLCRKCHLKTFKRKYKGIPGIPEKNQQQLDIKNNIGEM